MKPTKLSIILLAMLAVTVLFALVLAGCEKMGDRPSSETISPTTTAPTVAELTTETPVTDDSPSSPLPPPVSSTPTTTQAPVTTQRPIVMVPATEPEETLPPLELTIPIPDRGKMSQKVEAEIKATYADEYDADELKVEFVAKLGDAYAVFVDGPWEYPCMVTEQIVHGYLFSYSSGRTMTIYKDGACYSLPKAYEQGVIDAKQVLDLNLIRYGSVRVRDPEKDYSEAKLEYDFDDQEIIIVVFPEYNLYSYAVEDFFEIGCVDIRDLTVKVTAGKLCRTLSLTLPVKNKQNVLKSIQILQLRGDIYSAEPN